MSDEPELSEQIKSGRAYAWNDERFPGVTTLLGELNKPALPAWYAKVTAEFAVNEFEAWKKLDNDTAVDLLKGAPIRARDNAGNRGTKVHAAVPNVAGLGALRLEQELRRFERSMGDGELDGYVAGAVKFLQLFAEDVEAQEVTVFSQRYGYAGTADLLATLQVDGRSVRAVVDWKSGAGVYQDAALQMAAYALADWRAEHDFESGKFKAVDVGEVDALVAVHLRNSGEATAYVLDFDAETKVRYGVLLEGLAAIYRWKKQRRWYERKFEFGGDAGDAPQLPV